MNPSILHSVFFGATRFGKSKACLRMNSDRIGKRDSPAFVVCDPPGSMAEEFAIHALRKGLFASGKVIFDELAETANVPGYDFLTAPSNPDPDQQEAEIRERIFEAKAVMLRSRGMLDASKSPLIDEGLTAALNLYLYQKTPVAFSMLKRCFNKESDAHQYLVANCTNPEWVSKFKYYGSLPLQQWEYKCGPAQRVLDVICTSPQFRKRSLPTFDLTGFLNRGGMLLLSGKSKGNLSRGDMGLLMGMVILMVIQAARSGQLSRRVVLIIDEGVNASLIDGHVARALAEAAKWGLEIQLIVQNPTRFPSPEIRDAVYQNCATQYVFKQVDHEAARYAASLIGIPNLEPLKVRYVEIRHRTIEDQFDLIEIPIESSSVTEDEDGNKRVGKSQSVQKRPRRINVEDEIPHYWSLDDQIQLYTQMIVNLEVGECFIRQGNYVTSEPKYIPLLEEPWSGTDGKPLWYVRNVQTLAQRKLELAIQELKKRPEYQTRVIDFSAWIPKKASARSGGGKGTKRSLNG